MPDFKLEEIWEHEWDNMQESLELTDYIENIEIIPREAL